MLAAEDHATRQATVLTPAGRGAVAVIRCLGTLAQLDGSGSASSLCFAHDGRPLNGRAVDRITFARWGTQHPEDVVLCQTDTDHFEIQCHGGTAAVRRILEDLSAIGITEAATIEAGNCTHRLLESAWRAVSLANTLTTADWLLTQAQVNWPAFLEHPSADAARTALTWARFGEHLTRPWTVALCGRPNAGKSSLMNALAGFHRSIVNAQPGTTRDTVTLELALDGWPVRLIDTAGLRDSTDQLEAEGIVRARQAMAQADLVVHVSDATAEPDDWQPGAIRVLNKIDLTDASAHLPEADCQISARCGTGIEELIRLIVNRLIPVCPDKEQLIPVSPEQVQWLDQLASSGR